MGRPGSDQSSLSRRKIERWEKDEAKPDEAGPLGSAVLSLKRVNDSSVKDAHTVELRWATPGKRSPSARSQRFSSRSQDDFDGRAVALRFALATDTLVSFRSFLFGKTDQFHRGSLLAGADASTSGRTDGSVAGTGISNKGESPASLKAKLTSFLCVRQHRHTGLWFAVAICRLGDGVLRSISFKNSSKLVGTEGRNCAEATINRGASFLRSGAFKDWVRRVSSQTLNCGGEAGNCRQDGGVLPCKRCGALEHPQCHGLAPCLDKQAREDYICSTCLVVEREEIIAIRLEEQGELGVTSAEDLGMETRIAPLEADGLVCCLCGCEDNEDFDALVPCSCEASSAIVHPSCAAAVIESSLLKVPSKQTSKLCHVCGQGILSNGDMGMLNQPKTGGSIWTSKRQVVTNSGMKRSVKVAPPNRGVKRPRSTVGNGAGGKNEGSENESIWNNDKGDSDVQAVQSGQKDYLVSDSEKQLGVTLLGRRFNDVAVAVPIKKRRIQMAQVMRSPSPPPRSPSPIPQQISEQQKMEVEDHGIVNVQEARCVSEDMEMANDVTKNEVVRGGGGASSEYSVERIDKQEGDGSIIGMSGGDARCKGRDGCENPVAEFIGLNQVEGNNAGDKPMELEISNQLHICKFGDQPVEQKALLLKREDESICLTFRHSMKDEGLKEQQQDQRLEEQWESSEENKKGLDSKDVPIGENVRDFLLCREVPEDHLNSSNLKQEPSDIDMNTNIGHAFSQDKAQAETDSQCDVRKDSHDDDDGRATELALTIHRPFERVNMESNDVCLSAHGELEKSEQKGRHIICNLDETEQGVLLRLNSGYARDDRLHWDLNMEMEAWERPSSKVVDREGEASVLTESFTEANVSFDNQVVEDGTCEDTCLSHGMFQSRDSDSVHASVSSIGDGKDKAVQFSGNMAATTLQDDNCSIDMALSLQSTGTQDKIPCLCAKMISIEEGKDAGNDLSLSTSITGDSSAMTEKTLCVGGGTNLEAICCEDEVNDSVARSDEMQDTARVLDTSVVAIKTDIDASENFGIAANDGVEAIVDHCQIGNGHSDASCLHSDVVAKSVSSSPSQSKSGGNKAVIESMDEEINSKTDANAEAGPSTGDNVETVYLAEPFDHDVSDEEDELISESEKAVEELAHDDQEGITRHDGLDHWVQDPGEEPEAEEHVDYGDSDCRDADDIGLETDEKTSMALQAESDWKDEEPVDNAECELDNHVSCEREAVLKNFESAQEYSAEDLHRLESQDGKSFVQEESDNHIKEFVISESNGDGTQDADDVPEELLETVKMSETDQLEIEIRGDMVPGTNKLKSGDKEVPDVTDKQHEVHGEEGPVAELKSGRPGRIKSTGWDQLPEGFESAEDALRAVKENSARRGRGVHWTGAGGRGPILSPQGVSIARLGSALARGTSRADGALGERVRSDDMLRGRESFSHARRLEDGLDSSPRFGSTHEIGRGRSHGRMPSSSLHGRGRFDPWMDASGGSMGQWGPGRHRSPGHYTGNVGFGSRGPTNAAAVAAAKVESSGFIVAPDGTITKAGNATAAGRGGLRPIMGASRSGRGLMVNVGRGPPMDIEGGMNFHMRMNMGPGRGISVSSDGGVNLGRGRGMGPGAGPGLGGGLADRGGRGIVDRYRGASYGGGGTDQFRSDSHRRTVYPVDSISRRNRSLSPRRGRGSPARTSRSHTNSRSRSRTRSPRMRTSPKASSGIMVSGAGVARKRSRSPLGIKSEARVERSKTPPPAHRSVGSSRMSPGRSQRSPPPPTKWSSDKSVGDRFRDRDYKRPVFRARTPPRRTSPHVVHGSALMDERDRQVLAGAWHNSPTKLKQSEQTGSGSSGMVGRSGEGSSETRRLKRDEEEDGKISGSRAKEGDRGRSSSRGVSDKDRDNRSTASRREKSREDDRRRESSKLLNRDGRPIGSFKYASTRDGDDEVAPRRRRPS